MMSIQLDSLVRKQRGQLLSRSVLGSLAAGAIAIVAGAMIACPLQAAESPSHEHSLAASSRQGTVAAVKVELRPVFVLGLLRQ